MKKNLLDSPHEEEEIDVVVAFAETVAKDTCWIAAAYLVR